jgi:UDP-3-O-[3-hydroxymyristoyl] N-acetylglucosamine deacetylase
MRQQATLKTTVSIDGVGLHSGHPVRALFHPAPVDHGVVFLRRDHADQPVPAQLESASTFDYATTLKKGDVSIGTVEHVLAAAAGLGLDNCLIEIDGPEVPIVDGSALPFVRLFHAAGFERQDALVKPIELNQSLEVTRDDRRVTFEPDGPGLTITYEIDFPHPIVGRQEMTFTLRPDEFAARIAPARTFGFAAEVAQLRSRGLARGGSLHNAVVLDDTGIISGPLRFRDEFVRHKVLDLIGDLMLLGRPLQGRIHARKAGHALHIEFARALHAAILNPAVEAADDSEADRFRASGRTQA